MTPNKEDYLKCIYEIGIDLHKITNKEIAARMQVSPPAVTLSLIHISEPTRRLRGSRMPSSA